MKKIKTNALRILDQSHIPYEIREYEYDDNHLSGEHITKQIDLNAYEIYKTLVLESSEGYLVCCIPILEEIDLKKLAKVSGHKSVSLIHQKDLLSITGYLRGGCSPLAMKKKFPTYFQEDMKDLKRVAVSAGKRGLQVIVNPIDLKTCIQAQYVDVIRKSYF